MVRTIQISGDQVEVHDNKIEIHANVGPARILGLTLTLEDAPAVIGPKSNPPDQWEKELDELLAMTPPNPYPVDDSREAIYGPDSDEQP